jgi:hypothetical protein
MKAVMGANTLCDAAKARLLATPGEPFLFADWENVVFLHFTISPELLRAQVPPPFQLEVWHDQAWLSLVALTMRRFRPGRRASSAALFGCLTCQRFLNFRTYATAGGESGALFLHGWFSRPWSLPWPSARFGFPYAFAESVYEHSPKNGQIRGTVRARDKSLSYAAKGETTEPELASGNAGRVPTEFLLERYTGFFLRDGQPHVFRAWHPPWLQIPLEAEVSDLSLLTARFPWFAEAKFIGAHFAPGFRDVWLGRAHRLNEANGKRRMLSAFFEMP